MISKWIRSWKEKRERQEAQRTEEFQRNLDAMKAAHPDIDEVILYTALSPLPQIAEIGMRRIVRHVQRKEEEDRIRRIFREEMAKAINDQIRFPSVTTQKVDSKSV